MTVLVTGATGLLGRRVMAEADGRGLDAAGLARSGSDFDIDICDDGALAAAFETVRPTLVVHTAAMTDIGRCEAAPLAAWQTNTRAVAVIAALCARRGCQLVHVSTDHYFTGDGAAAHREDSPVTLLNDYARQKYAAEAFALTSPGAIVVRTNILGRRGWGKPSFAEWALDVVDSDAEATLFEDSYISALDTASCARALFDLADRGAEGTVNVGSGSIYSKADFIRAVAAAKGKALTRAVSGSVSALDVPRAESLGLNVAKAEGILGYPLPPLDWVVAAVVAEQAVAEQGARP